MENLPREMRTRKKHIHCIFILHLFAEQLIRRVSLTEEVFVNADIPYVRCSHQFRHINLKPPEHRLSVVNKYAKKDDEGS